MTDKSPQAGRPINPVSVDDFLAWLKQRYAGDARCPMCAYDKWHVIVDGSNVSYSALSMFPNSISTVTWGKPVVQLECQRCAYLAVFAAVTLEEWVSAGKPAFEDTKDGK